MSADHDHQRLDAAFSQAKDELAKMLEQAAQASVDGTIGSLSHKVGPFTIAGAEVEVVIRNLQLVAGEAPTKPREARARKKPSARKSAAKRKAKARAKGTEAGQRGRPSGPVRTAVLEAFSDIPEAQTLSTEQVRDALVKNGVETTADNVHQQLRRLVQAGLLERAGRGQYRRSADTPAASAAGSQA